MIGIALYWQEYISVVAAMNWDEINKEIAKELEEKSTFEILVENMSKFDIDKWIAHYNV